MRLDRDEARPLPVARAVRCPVGEPGRLSGLAERREQGLKRLTAAQPLWLIRTVHHEVRQAYGAGEKRRYNATTDSWHHLHRHR